MLEKDEHLKIIQQRMAEDTPNEYTPVEHRLLMPVHFCNHLANSSLIVKKVISLFFVTDLPRDPERSFPEFLIKGRYEVNGSYMRIPVYLLSNRFLNSYSSKARVEESFSRLLSEVTQSVNVTQQTSQELQHSRSKKEGQARAQTNTSNIVHLTPEQEFKLTGLAQTGEEVESKGYRSMVLLENVSFTEGYVNVKVSSFVQKAREYRDALLHNKSKNKSELVLVANYNHLVKFRSAVALQLYFLIAKHQPLQNHLIISVNRLCQELGIKAKSQGQKLRAIRAAVSDTILHRSTCALKACLTQRKKNVDYFFVNKRDRSGILEIRLDFNSNEENKAELLAKNFDFIPHIKGGLKESVLLQIIARVADNLIDEKWVNCCINEAYRINRTNSKKHNAIGPMVWNLIKGLKFYDTYQLMDRYCELSPEVGLSIDEYRKKTERIQGGLGS